MKETKLVLICIVAVIFNPLAFAITPHINRGTLKEIPIETACKDLKISQEKLKRFETEYTKDFIDLMFIGFEVEKLTTFRQTFSETEDILYRVMLEGKARWVIAGDDKIQYQKVYFKDKSGKANLIYADFYWTDIVHENRGMHEIRKNVMPIIKDNKMAGIMVYKIVTYITHEIIDDDLNTDTTYWTDTEAEVFWNTDFSSADMRLYHGEAGDADKFTAGETTYNVSAYAYQELDPDISIESSKPLIDEKDPFKYTIQNAFDKNPATSYVEDTEDDLLFITIGDGMPSSKIAIINGYAGSESLYKKNNRLKEVSDDIFSEDGSILAKGKNRHILSDSCLDYQLLDWLGYKGISVKSIYKGDYYSDTCVAELDFFSKNSTWIFGGVK